MNIIPKTGFKGLKENWQSDLIAAFSVSMVALPLGLGIAIASGVPPMAGIISAIVGGLVTTFFRGTHLTINGPTAGLIAAILASIEVLDDGTGKTLNYVFAAIFVAGCLQVVFGMLKVGKFADLFHSSVVHGILAAIGVIIFVKQIHIALGTHSDSTHILDTMVDAFYQLPNANPFVLIISIVGLLLLIFHSKISYKFFHFLPAPMWVMILSIPFVYAFNFFEPHSISFLGKNFDLGPSLLINIPDNILDALILPNFSKINTLPFWTSVLSITIIASIESLASAKAVDKMDPYKRKTNLNKDLVAVGISTMVSGAIGGLPVINVIVRSTVNIHNAAKTKWSNFYHGALLLVFIFLLAPIIQKVPLCALAILLVYTGFKLASPKVFKHVYSQGIEQLLFFSGTLVLTLMTNLLVGLFGGLLLALVTHMLLAKMPVKEFFRNIYFSGSKLEKQSDGSYLITIKGIANFLGTLKIDKLLNQIPGGAKATVDFSAARLVDFSILEHIYDFQRAHAFSGGHLVISGLQNHSSVSDNKLALKISRSAITKLSHRQIKLKGLADSNGWTYVREGREDISYFETFHFFKSRPVEKSINSILNEEKGWEITDVRFEEGGYHLQEEYKTTLCLIKSEDKIPKFTIEKKAFPEKYLNLWRHRDIDYALYEKFSSDFIVKVEDKQAMKTFLTGHFKRLVKNSSVIHHLESNGEAILLFTDNLKLATVEDYTDIAKFAEAIQKLVKNKAVADTTADI